VGWNIPSNPQFENKKGVKVVRHGGMVDAESQVTLANMDTGGSVKDHGTVSSNPTASHRHKKNKKGV
jgi:hypothetical protein